MVERWNKLTVAGKDPEFLNNYNIVSSYGSIPNGEETVDKIDDKEK